MHVHNIKIYFVPLIKSITVAYCIDLISNATVRNTGSVDLHFAFFYAQIYST